MSAENAEKLYTAADVEEAVELVTKAFVVELQGKLGALDVVEVVLAVCRNLEAQVASDG